VERAELVRTDRQRAVGQALSRLSADATEAERRAVEGLAGALYDEREALEARARLMDTGRSLTESLRTESETYAAEVAELNRLLQAGAVDQETHARAMEQTRERMLRASREWSDGIERALKDYAADATDAAAAAEQVTSRAFGGMEDALVAFTLTGRAEFRAMAEAIIADIARIATRMAVGGLIQAGIGVATGLIGGGSGAFPAGGGTADQGLLLTTQFHRGGIAGADPVPQRRLPAALFDAAPRLHQGLLPGEFPAVLQRGEGVFTPGQMAALGRVNIVINNNAGVDVSTRESGHGHERDITVELNRAVARAVRTRNSPAYDAVLELTGARPGMVQR
jgi:hypothetical protein